MAIEEVEEQDGQEQPKEVVVSEVQNPEQTKTEVLEAQVEMLTKLVMGGQGQTGQASSSEMKALVEMLGDKLDGSTQDNNGQLKFDRLRLETQMDADDILPREEWVTFVTHNILYVIVDDKRNGRVSQAPIDRIIFKYASTKQVKQGRETDLLNISTYTCRSKRELKWLKEHSFFNVMFFDNISTAMTADVERAAKMAQHVIRLQGVGQHQLKEMAKGYDITVGADMNLNSVRAQIAAAIVDKDMSSNRTHTENMLLEQKMEADAAGLSVEG